MPDNHFIKCEADFKYLRHNGNRGKSTMQLQFCLPIESNALYYDSMSIGGCKQGFKRKLVPGRVRETKTKRKMRLLTIGKIQLESFKLN